MLVANNKNASSMMGISILVPETDYLLLNLNFGNILDSIEEGLNG